ncbi:MAG: hypothetical protein HW421_1767 [Ignavibacteria bacterium]|nr:hypothetical protein [Ignavibacteria bacterium]
MTIEEQVKYWFDLADDDLIVAESNLNNNHYLWCLFICHLTIEKALKGLYVQFLNETPPKIHDLVKLANFSQLNLTDIDLRFLLEMNKFNIEASDPDYKEKIKKIATSEFTEQKLLKTKEIILWLKSLMK